MIFRLNWCKNIINGERMRAHVGASSQPTRGGLITLNENNKGNNKKKLQVIKKH